MIAMGENMQYGKKNLWVRPLAMFMEQIEVEGKSQPRFAYIGEE